MRVLLMAMAMNVGILAFGIWAIPQYNLGLPFTLAVWTFLMFASGLVTGTVGVMWVMSRFGNGPGAAFDYTGIFPQEDPDEAVVEDGLPGLEDRSSPIGGVASNV